MDTPDPGFVKDSQQSRSNVTPKSAAFGSPIATQDSWTAPPRRRQVQQKPKASFLADDDDDDGNDEQDEQNGKNVITNPQETFDGHPGLDSISYDFDRRLDEETDDDRDVYNQSPTPHASQAARLPPQSAQPAPRSSMTHSSDEFVVFESLKKQPAGAGPFKDLSKMPKHPKASRQKQKQALVTQDRPVSEGEKETPAKDTAPRPRTAARKSVANSKVKLAALEVEGEAETRKPEIQEPHEYDYSLPASQSSSPATSPVKKKVPAKKQAVKKPAAKSKSTQRDAKASAGGRAKNTKPAPDPPVHQSSEAHSDESSEHNSEILLAEEPPIVTQAPQEANKHPQMKHQKVKPAQSAPEDQNQNVVMLSSDSTTSFPESENADDEDFQCSRKVTPANARRRTRAAAAESAAAKEAKKKAESRQAAVPSVPRHDAEDDRTKLDAVKRPKMQTKQPPKKATIEKAEAVATRTKHESESTGEMKSSAGKSKKNGSTNKRTTATNATSKAKREIEQESAVSSSGNRVGRDEASKPSQTLEPVKQTRGSDRKPNIVAFGPGGPKNNGKSHKAAATTDPRSRAQQPVPIDAEHPADTKSQLPKAVRKAVKTQPNTTVRNGDSHTNNSAGHVEGGLSRAARASQSTLVGAVPDNAPISKVDHKVLTPHLDAKTTALNYEAEGGDASDPFVAHDAESDMAVEVTANLIEDAQDYQDHDMANDFEEAGDGKVFSPLAQADIKHLHRREQHTVLGEMDVNHRTSPKDVPAIIPRLMKRKLPDMMTIEERSPTQQALPLKTGSQSVSFPRISMNSAPLKLPSEGVERPMKKSRYNPAPAVRVNEDASCGSNLFDGPGSLSRGVGDDTVDNIFGPGKMGKTAGPSAFVQRLISNDSADRGPGLAGWVAPAPSGASAAPRQNPIAISHPATGRTVAPGLAVNSHGSQQLDDVGKRMLAALVPERKQVSSPWSPSDDTSKTFLVDDPTGSSLGDAFDQRKASGADESAQAWKKATEPYAESLGVTMHKIVNTILRGLKTNEAAVGDVVEDYREDGKRVVERIADKHGKERLLITQQQEQNRLIYVERYREARHVAGSLLGKLESVDIDKMMANIEKDAANRLKQLQQTVTDA